MALSVNNINTSYSSNLSTAFRSNKKVKDKNENENPISQKGECSKLVLGTFLAGLGFGMKALFELFDGDFIIDELSEQSTKIADKNFKNAPKTKYAMASIGAAIGLVGIYCALVAILYTIFNAPKIKYESKVNNFSKGKDMDVYIKGNSIEKELYTQMNEKAKTASQQEKQELEQQYLLLKKSKNKVPDFIEFQKSKHN